MALSLFQAMRALHILDKLLCVRELQCPQTKRRIFWVQLLVLFQPQQWWSRSFSVSRDFLSQPQFWSDHLPRSTTQTSPVRRFPRIAQCLSRPTFASHKPILGNAQNCSCSIMMTDEDSMGHAACKRTVTVLTSFSSLLSKVCHWRPHLVRDLRCKTRKPTE